MTINDVTLNPFISPFDLAAALGLDRPLDPSEMVAMVAEQRKQRDDVRRELCRELSDGRFDYSERIAAMDRGWGYLYPEEPALEGAEAEALGLPLAPGYTP